MFHCLLASTVSDKKYSKFQIVVPLKTMYILFSGCFSRQSLDLWFSVVLLQFAKMLFSLYLSCLRFTELPKYVNLSLSLNFENLGALLIKYFFSPILSWKSDYTYVWLLGVLLKVCEALFTFFNHFSFYSLDWILCIGLYI